MSARILILLFMLLRLAYNGITTYLEIQQRKKPLPAEVSDIYDSDRYAQFLTHESDINKLYYAYQLAYSFVEIPLLFSSVFSAIERWVNGNVYLVFLVTGILYWVIGQIFEVPYKYLLTFKIEEKYGLNKKDLHEFIKDELLDQLGELASLALFFLLIFIGEHLPIWTHHFSISWGNTILISLAIFAVVVVVVILMQLFQYFILKKQYTFTPLPEGELKDKIIELMKGCKKKVHGIYVYNESKKSVEKNAFLLKLLWHREFGIADNFITENAERELLAVLSHEIGHLKHKKNLLNYISIGVAVLASALIVVFIHNPTIFLKLNAWTRTSFNLSVNNYYLLFSVYGAVITPINFLAHIYDNYESRVEEDEADYNAVRNGYGEDLIETFKKMSTDELVDVNPHPVVEFLEDDHPSMYHRIVTIRKGIAGLILPAEN